MSINQSGWRPTAPEQGKGNVPASVTGNKALMLEEALIFEIGDAKTTGVDFGEGDVEHLHQLRPLRAGLLDPHDAAG